MAVDDVELRAVMPHLPAHRRAEALPALAGAMAEFGISWRSREAAFLATVAHETVELKYLVELGDRAYFERYDGRRDLGNVEPGDGWRYRGRGVIQVMGRLNYSRVGRALGVNLLADPGLLAAMPLAARSGAWWWAVQGLNAVADPGTEESMRMVTHMVNGGYNGMENRLHYWRRALLALSAIDRAEPGPAPYVVVDGEDLGQDALARLAGGRTYAALRPIADAARWRIVKAQGGSATLRTSGGSDFRVPYALEGSIAVVALADLPGTLKWDPGSRTATLDTPAPDWPGRGGSTVA